MHHCAHYAARQAGFNLKDDEPRNQSEGVKELILAIESSEKHSI